MRTIAVLVLLICGCAATSSPRCSCTKHVTTADVFKRCDADLSNLTWAINSVDEAIRIVTDNLANAETTAYKRQRLRINDHELRLVREFEQGAMENTGRQLDLAIQGNGFFCVKLPSQAGDGHGYVRNGAILINADGKLVVALGDGYPLDPPITLPAAATDVTVSMDGELIYKAPGMVNPTTAGQIKVALFISPEGLDEYFPSVFAMTESSGSPIICTPGDNGAGRILQGFLEGSNVDRVKEQVRLNYLTHWRDDLMEIAKRISPSSLLLTREAK